MAGSVIGSVASGVIGGVLNKKSGDKAAKAQQEAADKASEVQLKMYEQTREDLKPYRQTGTAANKKLSFLMGLGEFDKPAIQGDIFAKYPALAKRLKVQAAAPAQPEVVAPPAVNPKYVDTYRKPYEGLYGNLSQYMNPVK